MIRYITDHLEISSEDSAEGDQTKVSFNNNAFFKWAVYMFIFE